MAPFRFTYLQNNKALKLDARTVADLAGFTYLQNNKALKHELLEALNKIGFTYLQNNKALKPQIRGVKARIDGTAVPQASLLYYISP